MATRCPWFAHSATPDPAELKLKKGQTGACNTCWLRYRVMRVSPHVLARVVAGSTPTIMAVVHHGGAAQAKKYQKLLAIEEVGKAMSRLRLGRRG